MKYVSAVLLVKDLTTSRKFYEEYLGLQVQDDHGANIGYKEGLSLWDYEHANQNIFNIFEGHKTSNNEEHKMELYFETEDIEKTFKYILNANIPVMHEIRLQPWGQNVFRVYDPDGNIVEVGEAMSIVNERINSGND